MASVPRVSGKLLVTSCVFFTVTAVGVATVYLPFYADHERLRGVRKVDREIPKGAQQEILAHIEKEEAQRRELESQLAPIQQQKQQQQQAAARRPRSMWGMLDSKSKQQKQQEEQQKNLDHKKPLWKMLEEQQEQMEKQQKAEESGSDPSIRPDQMRLSAKAQRQIIDVIKAAEEEEAELEQARQRRKQGK